MPGLQPRVSQNHNDVCLLSPPQDLFWHISPKKKGQMFHTTIDRGDGGAGSKIKHLFGVFFFNTMRSWFSTSRSQDQADEFVLFNSERWTASGHSVAKQDHCCGTGRGEDQWPQPRFCLSPGEMFDVKDAAGKNHQMAEMMSAGIWSMSTQPLFFFCSPRPQMEINKSTQPTELAF